MGIIDAVLDAFQAALSGLHDLIEPIAGVHAWGWAIIALTLIVRVLLLPLAIKQIRSMRAMQAIQPRMKEIQKKYKVDRDLMKKDPEQYRAKRQKQQEEMMALYQEEGVNPAASCLPLLAQAPIFLALFNVLRGERAAELAGQPFYFITQYVPDLGLTALVSQAFWPGWLLVVLMAVTMFVSQKQTMARQTAMGADNPMAQQQKIMLYALPVLLAFFSIQIPLGVLLYWVTTNMFQAGQQAIMLREVKHEAEAGTLGAHPGGEAAVGKTSAKGGTPTGPRKGATSGSKDATSGAKGSGEPSGSPAKGGRKNEGGKRNGGRPSPGDASSNGATSKGRTVERDHLPRRRDRR